MDNVDRMLAVNAQQLACGQHSEATVLHNVGADPRPLMSLNRLAVELCAIELATSRIAITLKGDDADPPTGGDCGTSGAANARVLIDIRMHYECQVWHGLPRLL
jgi:hypothetical protein